MIAKLKTCAVCECHFKAHHRSNRCCSRKCAVKIRAGRCRKIDLVATECAFCAARVERKPSKMKSISFCGASCRGRYLAIHAKGANNPNYSDAGRKTCEVCFSEYRSYDSSRRFCSIACAAQGASGNNGSLYGYQAEDECCDILRRKGYYALKPRNSRGPFDVIARKGHDMLAIQVKSRTSSFVLPLKEFEYIASARVGHGVSKELWFKSPNGWEIWEQE